MERQKEREAGAQGAWLLSAGGRRARGCPVEARALQTRALGARRGRPRPERGGVGGTEEAGAGSASREGAREGLALSSSLQQSGINAGNWKILHFKT